MNIILCCTAGMSTSMLVSKMRKEAEKQEGNFNINAISVSDLTNNLESTNVILLGPQVRYAFEDINSIGKENSIPVDVINQRDYGLCDGKAVLDQAISLVREYKK
ncbi:PTS sugar transporter subunit IIB [Mammaliicoccus lentus]|uniref:PTS sugar transporter subunit IIB n=1 Tax=Mammaliicoccus lentus TaxID=42858 RepID=UPI001B335196|nr:PTS sugar transporter subunit IIB [Mammaliicoccus lentus]